MTNSTFCFLTYWFTRKNDIACTVLGFAEGKYHAVNIIRIIFYYLCGVF